MYQTIIVEYGTSLSYGNTSSLYTTLVTSHPVSLSGLQANTQYHYRVKSKDEAGNLATSGDYTFTTPTITPPPAPTIAGFISSNQLNGANDVYVSGKYAYVTAFAGDSLTIIDVSNPASPTVVGSISTAGSITSSQLLDGPNGIYVSGQYAYVAAFYSNSLSIINVSSPTSL